MLTCSQCQTPLALTDAICPQCGIAQQIPTAAPLKAPAPLPLTAKCVQCNAPTTIQSLLCTACQQRGASSTLPQRSSSGGSDRNAWIVVGASVLLLAVIIISTTAMSIKARNQRREAAIQAAAQAESARQAQEAAQRLEQQRFEQQRQVQLAQEANIRQHQEANLRWQRQARAAAAATAYQNSPQPYNPPPVNNAPQTQSQAMFNIEMAFMDAQMAADNASTSQQAMGGMDMHQYMDAASQSVKVIEANLPYVQPFERDAANQRYMAAKSIQNRIMRLLMGNLFGH